MFCFGFPNSTKNTKHEQIIRELRDLPPVHYSFKIENFSHLYYSKTSFFELGDFEVGGYNWRLRLDLHPITRNWKSLPKKKRHISLHLVLSESSSLSLEHEVNVYFKLFLYNQIHDKYLTVQDANGRVRRFRGMNTKCGFDQFLQLGVFHDESSGYLIKDTCMFGAEIFVLDSSTRKDHRASLVKELGHNTYTWKLMNFEKLNKEFYTSGVFVIGGYKWTMSLYPNGVLPHKGKWLSVSLTLEDSETLNLEDKLNVEYHMSVKDQLHGKHHGLFCLDCYFTSSNKSMTFTDGLIPLSKLNDTSTGYIINGAIIIEVQISLLAVETLLS